jgi:cell division protein FtsQ
MGFLGRKRQLPPVQPRKNQWKDPQGERAAKELSLVKTARLKPLSRWVGLAAGTGLVAWFAAMGVQYSGPALETLLEIKTITVEGDHYIDKQKVLEPAKVNPGTGLHHIVTEAIKEHLKSHPWVKEAEVTRVPLHELRISLVERIPAAVIRADSQNFLTDAEGHVLTRLGQADNDALPLVTGIDSKGLLEGAESVRRVIASGIKLAKLVGQTFDGRLQVSAENPSNLVALVQGVRFQFGEEAVGEQWTRFRRVKPTLKTLNFGGHGLGVNEVDLRYENRIVVREGG